jgi:hypothetical protein
MIIAQSMGEYGAASMLSSVVTTIESGVATIQASMIADQREWIGAGIVLVVVYALFRRRN